MTRFDEDEARGRTVTFTNACPKGHRHVHAMTVEAIRNAQHPLSLLCVTCGSMFEIKERALKNLKRHAEVTRL
jgi:hypothetical protein